MASCVGEECIAICLHRRREAFRLCVSLPYRLLSLQSQDKTRSPERREIPAQACLGKRGNRSNLTRQQNIAVTELGPPETPQKIEYQSNR
eukprot:6087604-Amphidinium_carterae.1